MGMLGVGTLFGLDHPTVELIGRDAPGAAQAAKPTPAP